MRNAEIGQLFGAMADLLEIKGENPFRIRAYRRAAQSLETLSEDIEIAAREERLKAIPGIGGDLAAKIVEYLATGRIAELETAREAIPRGVVEMLEVPGLGPRTAKLLFDQAGVRSLAELEERARAGQLRGLPGIQAKTEANILKGIEILRRGQERMPLGRALPLAQSLVQALERLPDVDQLVVAGSIRRRRETVGDMDILITSSRPAAVMEAFAALPDVASVIGRGPTKASVRLREGLQVDLRVVEPESFGAALVYFTGSKQHNIRIREMAQRKRLKISEYGVFDETTGQRVAGRTEEDVYRTIGLPWIPPELREDAGEIEAALANRLPPLVEVRDIRGDLHDHTDASDGRLTIEALVESARARGYQYVVVSDHSRSSTIARGLSADDLLAHVERVRAVGRRFADIAVLAGSECDVLPDGTLDYPDEVLSRLDIVLAAVHSHFTQPREEMTRRLCAALAHPSVNILAHPTGRRLGQRDASAVDLDLVFQTAARLGKAVEINASPGRLDLGDVPARRAVELGALVAISTDTHAAEDLANVELGVAIARRAWIGPERVINTWPLDRLRAWIATSRSDASGHRVDGGLSMPKPRSR